MGNSHKYRNATKKEFMDKILPNEFNATFKLAHQKGIIQGYELCNQMLLEYSKEHTIEEIIKFCEKNIKEKDIVKNIIEK